MALRGSFSIAMNARGALERGQGRAAPALQFVRCHGRTRHDVRHRHLAPQAIRQSHHRRLGDLRLFREELLDLARINIESAGDDHIAAPSHQRVVAVWRTDREIACAKPSVRECGARSIGSVPIAGKNVRPAQMNFTGFSLRDFIAFGIHQAHRNTGQGESDRARAALAKIWVTQIHERFAHAVALQNGMAEQRTEIL